MLQNVVEIAWNDLAYAIPAGLTIIVMPFTFHRLRYRRRHHLLPHRQGRPDDWRDVRPGQWVLAALFVVYFFVRTGGVLG